MAGVYRSRHPERTVLPPHLHFLVTEGGMDAAGVFHKIPRIDDSRLGEIFAREVPADFVRKKLLSPEWAERILSWRHTGFNVHSQYIHRSSEADVCGGEAPALPCFYRGSPDGSRGVRGLFMIISFSREGKVYRF